MIYELLEILLDVLIAFLMAALVIGIGFTIMVVLLIVGSEFLDIWRTHPTLYTGLLVLTIGLTIYFFRKERKR